MKPASLYICYQSIAEPLTQTQVAAYLEGLAQAGYPMLLLTFEPQPLTAAETEEWRRKMQAKGITWHWRRYHKWPTVPATAWDILVGILTGLLLIRQHRVGLIHARNHVPGLMGWMLQRLTRVKLLFDLRGFMAEEYVDAGVWPAGGWLFRVTKCVERWLVGAADGIIVLTRPALELLRQWYPDQLADKPVRIIPCCVDWRQNRPSANGHEATLVYAGKLGGWYPLPPLVDFLAEAAQVVPDLQCQVWTQSQPEPLVELIRARGLEKRVRIGRAAPEEMPARLAEAGGALALIQPSLSKRGSSPTKIAEYLAAGLPVVASDGIGDVDETLNGVNGVGVLVRQFDRAAYRQASSDLARLMRTPGIAQRCRQVAREQFDLVNIGWQRYQELYDLLIGGKQGHAG